VRATAPRGASGRFRFAALCAVAAALAGQAACADDDLQVHAEARGSAVAIEAQANVHATLAVAWTTLTDYDHLAEFVPGMIESRVVERHGAAAIIEQRGELRVLFFHFPVTVRLSALEHYPSAIDAHSIGGNIRVLSAGYTLQRAAGEQRLELRWTGIVQPEFWTPMFVTVPVLRDNIERQFAALVHEIERRQARRTDGGA